MNKEEFEKTQAKIDALRAKMKERKDAFEQLVKAIKEKGDTNAKG